MIDTHAHLNFLELKTDLENILERAREAGVDQIVNPGTSLETSLSAFDLTTRYPNIYSAVGVHPTDAREFSPEILAQLARLAVEEKVVAVGEVGLDYFHFEDCETEAEVIAFKAKQEELFRAMITLANDIQKPLIIHTREAFAETYQILKDEASSCPAVIHCFSGTTEQAHAFLDLGYYLSVTGMITYKKNEAMRDTVKTIPLDRLFIETDAPFLAPEGYRGKVCEPMYVRHVAECIAELSHLSLEQVDKITTENSKAFFNLK